MSTIQHKRSSVAGHVPSSLLVGELAINEADSILYFNGDGFVTPKRLVEPRRLITRGAVTSVASLTLDLTPANIGTYSGFDIYLSEVRAASDSQELRVRVGNAAGLNTGASSYKTNVLYHGTDMAVGVWGDASGTLAYWNPSNTLGNQTGEGGFFVLRLSTNDANYAYTTKLFSSIVHNSSFTGRPLNFIFAACEMMTVIALTQIQFYFASANISTMSYALIGIP